MLKPLLFQCLLTLSSLQFISGKSPALTSPGSNTSILVFVDLHLSYHANGSCSEPVWENFEWAQSLIWKNKQNTEIGIEVYDTCGSTDRILGIIRQRLYSNECNAPSALPVSGIISYTSPEVSVVISGALRLSDVIHVVVGDDTKRFQSATYPHGQLFADLSSTSNIEFLTSILKQLDWNYITTISDSDPVSLREHSTFLTQSNDKNICIQYSQTIDIEPQIDLGNVKTPGVVIFTANMDSIGDILEKLPVSTAVFVVTHDRRTSGFRFFQNGMIMSDDFNYMANFSDYMSQEIWNQTGLDGLTTEYYLNNHNCSLNDTTQDMECPDILDMRAHFYNRTSGRTINILNSVYDLVLGVASELLNSNCSSFSVSQCFSMDNIKDVKDSVFRGLEKNVLFEKPPYSVFLTLIMGGKEQKAGNFTTYSTFDSLPDLNSWIGSVTSSFPASECKGWCPTCYISNCDVTSDQIAFDGAYHYVPGDILLVGMFPFSLKWDRQPDYVCSGVSTHRNMDIMYEAFLFAIKTYHDRYNGIMPDVDVGALVFDTCSDINRGAQIAWNFESCQYRFERVGNSLKPTPRVSPALIVAGEDSRDLTDLNKLWMRVDKNGNIYGNGGLVYDTSAYNYEAVVNLLHAMDWTYTGVVTSSNMTDFNLEVFYEVAFTKNICIAYHSQVSTNDTTITSAMKTIQQSVANTVVMFLKSSEIDRFFRMLTSKTLVKTWIIVETRQDSLDIASYPLPLGTMVFQRQGKENNEFNKHLQNINNKLESNGTVTANPWLSTFETARGDCGDECSFSAAIAEEQTRMQASDVIKTVDIAIHAIYKAQMLLCGENSSSLCEEFRPLGTKEVKNSLNGVWFPYQQENIRLSPQQMLENYVISSVQASGTNEVGQWIDQKLILEKDRVISYNSNFEPLSKPRDSYCFTSCACVNFYNTSANGTVTRVVEIELDQEMGYKDSSAEFDTALWSIITVIIAGSSCLVTLFLMVFIMCKVCAGALVRRYLVLGLFLLLAMLFLFLSVLPFVFTPSEAVCGMRYFAHGVSYAMCFAIILTKMTTLRDYKYIGLGGEISRINQLLSVFFITAVQVAIGVQWWVLRSPIIYTERMMEQVDGLLIETTYYACDFKRGDFIAYHSFVLFLIVVCCLYSISVRKETKNMKEAKLLLVCSWFCLLLWIAMIVTIFVLQRDYLEAICAIGILANALSMMLIIYLPKLSAISRLKYEVSEQSGRKENGYKVDPDFHFERPYSLPGTMHSSITDKTLSYPRSLTAFDTNMSY